MGKIKISAVSYLNSTPFVYGIEQKLDKELYQLELDNPAVCAEKLLTGQVELGLVPVAIIPSLKEHHIISEYCIGSVGKVRSVMLYSDVELNKIECVILDNQSRTSVMLTRVLAKHLWKINPQWIPATAGFEGNIGGATAGVVIGDRTFAMEGKFRFTYDLSEEWATLTGLPFVFACWVSNRPLPSAFITAFNEALAYGLAHLDAVIAQIHTDLPPALMDDYLRHSISYSLDEKKKKALNLFLEMAGKL